MSSFGSTSFSRASRSTTGNFRMWLFRSPPDLSLRTSQGILPPILLGLDKPEIVFYFFDVEAVRVFYPCVGQEELPLWLGDFRG